MRLRDLLRRTETQELGPVVLPTYGDSGSADPSLDLSDPRVIKELIYAEEEEYYRQKARDEAR